MTSFARPSAVALLLCLLAATNPARGCSLQRPGPGEEAPDTSSPEYFQGKADEASSVFRCELVSIVGEHQVDDPTLPDDVNGNQLVTCNVVEKWKGEGAVVGEQFVISTTYGHLCGLAGSFVGNEGQEYLIYSSSSSGEYERVSQGTWYDYSGDVTLWENVSDAELGVLNSLVDTSTGEDTPKESPTSAAGLEALLPSFLKMMPMMLTVVLFVTSSE